MSDVSNIDTNPKQKCFFDATRLLFGVDHYLTGLPSTLFRRLPPHFSPFTNMTPRKEQPEQQQQSLSQALLTDLQGRSMPGHDQTSPARRMSREEQQAYLMSTIQLALDITSGDVDVSSTLESPKLASSTSWPQ